MDDIKKLEKLESLLNLVDKDTPSTEEIVELFGQIVSIIQSNKESADADIEVCKDEILSLKKHFNAEQEVSQGDVNELRAQLNEWIRKVKELRLQKGDKGDKGEPGKNYIITQADKDEILLDVLSQVPQSTVVPETPEETVEKVNLSKVLIEPTQVKGLNDIERIAKANAYTRDGVSKTEVAKLTSRVVNVESLTSGYTEGSIPFADSNGELTENNSLLNWDNTNNRLGIGGSAGGYPFKLTSAVDGTAMRIESSAGAAHIGISSTGLTKIASIIFYSSTAARWQIGKSTADEFFVYDSGNARNLFSSLSGNLTLVPAGGNVYLSGSGNMGIGQSTAAEKLTVTGRLVLQDSSSLYATSKFDSQGTAWSSSTALSSIIMNGAAGTRPEISWYRGSRTYPEASIRQHVTADNGLQIYIGNGQVAPVLAATWIYNSGTPTCTLAGALAIAGTLTGVTTLAASGNISTATMSTVGVITMNFSSANTFSNGLQIYKRGTTGDATAAITSATEIGYHSFYAWDGTAHGRAAYVLVRAAENFATGAHGASYAIATTNIGANDATIKMTIADDGNVGIGTTTPTAVMHLKAGTATAETAPLKFTSGTNLTSPEAGAMEYDGTDLTITDSSSTRRKLTRKYIEVRLLDKSTDTSATTTVGGDFRLPFNCVIKEVGAYVDTAGTTGTMTVDIHLAGTTIMTANKISIETGEKSSLDAATQPALTTTSYTRDAILTFDIDAVQTTPAKGLVIWLDVVA